MTDLTSTEIIAIVFVVVLAVIVVGLLLYLLRRLKGRRAKLLGELEDKPELNQDRAFNRIAMARREIGILVGQGVDVRRAQDLIADAQGAFDTRQYDRAYRLAQSAHEALVNARQAGARTTGAPLPSKGPGTAPPSGTMGAAPVAGVASASATPERPTIPKDRAESQFQLRLLGEELDALPAGRAQQPSVAGATALRNQASAAFDRGDYSGAFRLALKGRRTLGDSLESLPPPGAPTIGAPKGGAGGAASDANQSAEAAAGGERCPDCGYPAVSGDVFCRGCGRPQTPLTCPTCGAPRGAEEPFCGRCGSRFP
ncbi:MAG: zinc ribbon domain-containing protein [Thermoplasmata archaeon]